MEEVHAFASDSDCLALQRNLFARVDAGELQVLPTTHEGPFYTRRFLEKSTNEVWVLVLPDFAFRGYFKREGLNGTPASTS